MFLFSLFVILLTGCYFALKSAFKKKQKETRSLLISDKKDPEVNESIDITTCIPLVNYGEVIEDLIVEEGQDINLNIPFVIVDGEFSISYGDKEVCKKITGECVFYTLGVLTSVGDMKCRALKKSKITLLDLKSKYILFSIFKKKCVEIVNKYFRNVFWFINEEKKMNKDHNDSIINDDHNNNPNNNNLPLNTLPFDFLKPFPVSFKILEINEFLKRKGQSFNDLFFIHYGEITLKLETGEEFTFKEGDFVGFFNLFFDIFGLIEIFANSKTKISIYEYDTLKRNGFTEEDFPFELFSNNFPDFFKFVDVSCEWLILKPGIVLDQNCENFFYVIDGECKGNKIYKEGMTINCEECLTQKKSKEIIKISKISNLIKIKKSLIEEFMRNKPKPIEIIKVLYNKNVNLNQTGSIITILPADKQSNVHLFTRRLKGSIGKDCLLLGIREISEVLSKRVFTICEELRITDYLKRMTRVYPAVIVYLENEYSRFLKYLLKYSKTCLITGSLLKCPGELSKMLIYCEIEYVRLYEKRDCRRNNIVKGKDLKEKGVVMEDVVKGKDVHMNKNKDINLNDNIFHKKISFNRVHHVVSPSRTVLFDTKDFERLGRFLLGKRIGLVLSGGGARGVAHIGVIQALEEEGIPIDIVGGTSMGAFIGALYARDCDNSHVFRDSKKFCSKARSIWPFLFDLTYPLIAFFTGRGINKTLKGIFKTFSIQDLWLEYFCITTNLFTNDEEVHRSGLIWKYVRASMGICGYLPPVCDQRGFLVDGGYINNVPADVMLNMGVSLVLAIDIGTVYSNDYDHYGEYFDGFVALIHKYFGTRKYLTIEEIQYRIAFLTTEKKVKELESNPKILLMRPDLGDVKTGDFNKFDEIVAQGYQAGRAKIKEWKENGIYEKYFVNKKRTRRRYSV